MPRNPPDDHGFSSASPLTSPVDEVESDTPLAHPPEMQEQSSLPGLDGAPVRCEFALFECHAVIASL